MLSETPSERFRVTTQCFLLCIGELPWDLSDKLSFWGDRRDYWNYLSEGIGRMKALETIVKQVQTLAHVSHVIPSTSHVIVT